MTTFFFLFLFFVIPFILVRLHLSVNIWTHRTAPAGVTKEDGHTRHTGVCMCVCVFIKLHITAQSGLVILVILCHSH